MPPSQLLHYHVPAKEHFANVHRMVSPYVVVLYAFVFGVVVLVDLPEKVSQVILDVVWRLILLRERNFLGGNILKEGVLLGGAHQPISNYYLR